MVTGSPSIGLGWGMGPGMGMWGSDNAAKCATYFPIILLQLPAQKHGPRTFPAATTATVSRVNKAWLSAF